MKWFLLRLKIEITVNKFLFPKILFFFKEKRAEAACNAAIVKQFQLSADPFEVLDWPGGQFKLGGGLPSSLGWSEGGQRPTEL